MDNNYLIIITVTSFNRQFVSLKWMRLAVIDAILLQCSYSVMMYIFDGLRRSMHLMHRLMMIV